MIILPKIHAPQVSNHSLIYSFAFIATFLLFSSTLSAQPTIVLNSAADDPLTTSSHNGFLDEVGRIIFNKVGYTLVIEKLPAERALRSANSGLIDGEIIRVAGLDKIYPNLIRVPESMIALDFVAFSKNTTNLKQGWAALADKEVAFITGWKIFEKKVPETSSITKTNNSEQLFTLLKNNRADLVLYNRWAGYHMINKLKIEEAQLQLPVLARKDMFIYLHKKHKALVPQLTQALAELKKNGRYKILAKKHLTPLSRTHN